MLSHFQLSSLEVEATTALTAGTLKKAECRTAQLALLLGKASELLETVLKLLQQQGH